METLESIGRNFEKAKRKLEGKQLTGEIKVGGGEKGDGLSIVHKRMGRLARELSDDFGIEVKNVRFEWDCSGAINIHIESDCYYKLDELFL